MTKSGYQRTSPTMNTTRSLLVVETMTIFKSYEVHRIQMAMAHQGLWNQRHLIWHSHLLERPHRYPFLDWHAFYWQGSDLQLHRQ